ncbi:hypothetical protein ACFQ64_18085 [Streptomyces sp. NPDC056460]|uniref:hypothetical protein n=1 Tax=Streptomyces sp. NPDC056460 TaxID=3345825 RepID=UPI0036B5F8C4
MITLGVEEEYLLVDPATAVPTPAVEEVRRAAGLGPFAESAEIQDELLQAQIEVATPVCWSRPLARERRPAAVRRSLRVREPS